jgi:peptide chain release factor 3
MPSFSPEKFAYISLPNPSAYHAYNTGVLQLLDEGAIQLLKERGGGGGEVSGVSILAAVGELQFEVVLRRLKDEYGVEATLEHMASFCIARWAASWEAVDRADEEGKLFNVRVVQDRWGRPVLLFRNEWKAKDLEKEEGAGLRLQKYSLPPMVGGK